MNAMPEVNTVLLSPRKKSVCIQDSIFISSIFYLWLVESSDVQPINTQTTLTFGEARS